MKISFSRLSGMLEPLGFVTRRTSGFMTSYGFVRHDQVPDLYQQIEVCFAGRDSEAVFAYVAVSVTRWIKLKGLSESRLVDEIAQNKERGWTIITMADQAIEWEELLARAAPTTLAEFSAEIRSSLLERTEEARRQAHIHLDRLGQGESLTTQILNLKRRLPPALTVEAERLVNASGVVQLKNAEEAYFLACLLIVGDGGNEGFVGKDPLVNEDLMWQIQLVTDGILSRTHLRK